WQSVVDASVPGWQHTGLRIAELGDGDLRELPAGDVERLVIPLAGTFHVDYQETTQSAAVDLEGRSSVFAGPPDVAYLPVGSAARISGRGRVAVAEAPATERHPFAYIPKNDVP